MENNAITIETTVNAPIGKVWEYWNNPEHIKQWAFAADTWHAPHAENDIQVGGKFSTTMAAKDGSVSFDFQGRYDNVKLHKYINYTFDDGRAVEITFLANGEQTEFIQIFEAEVANDIEMQRAGWHAIFENFKKLVEQN